MWPSGLSCGRREVSFVVVIGLSVVAHGLWAWRALFVAGHGLSCLCGARDSVPHQVLNLIPLRWKVGFLPTDQHGSPWTYFDFFNWGVIDIKSQQLLVCTRFGCLYALRNDCNKLSWHPLTAYDFYFLWWELKTYSAAFDVQCGLLNLESPRCTQPPRLTSPVTF